MIGLTEEEFKSFERIEDTGDTHGLAWLVDKVVTRHEQAARKDQAERIAQAIEGDSDAYGRLMPPSERRGQYRAARIALQSVEGGA